MSDTPDDEAEVGPQQLIMLGKTIEAARTRAGISARQAAEASGISPTYLRAIERGVNPKTKAPSRPSAEHLRAVAGTVGLDPADVLEQAGYSPSLAATPIRGRSVVQDPLRQIQEAARSLDRRTPFIADRAREQLGKFAADFRLVAEGTLTCSPGEDARLRRLALQQCNRTIRDVSVRDERWWSGSAGQRYLDLHDALLGSDAEPRVDITRIFITDADGVHDLKTTLERHVSLGIRTYVVFADEVGPRHLHDLTIYDDELLREARFDQGDDGRAEFTDDPLRVSRALLDFGELEASARSGLAEAKSVLKRMKPTSPAADPVGTPLPVGSDVQGVAPPAEAPEVKSWVGVGGRWWRTDVVDSDTGPSMDAEIIRAMATERPDTSSAAVRDNDSTDA